MNEKVKWLTGTSVIGFIAVFALHGEAFIKALMSLPALITAYAAGLPFGATSFLLSLALAALVFSMARRNFRCRYRREFFAELLALLVALTVTLAQQYFGAEPSTTPRVLQAVLLGLLAGLSAPFLVRGMMAAGKTGG